MITSKTHQKNSYGINEAISPKGITTKMPPNPQKVIAAATNSSISGKIGAKKMNIYHAPYEL